MKSKIPCEPGPAPLMKLAQATGLCGGTLVPRSLNPPPARSFCRLGSRPAFIMRSRQARVHAVDADDDHLLAGGSRRAAAAAEPVVAGAQPGGAGGRGRGRP